MKGYMLFNSADVWFMTIGLFFLDGHVISLSLRVNDQVIVIKIPDQLAKVIHSGSEFFSFSLYDIFILSQRRDLSGSRQVLH